MIIYLLAMICILSVVQSKRSKFAAVCYAALCAGHALLFGHIEGSAYFLSAAVIDALIVTVLCYKAEVTRLADLLISISMISGFVNFIGWGMWWVGYDSDAYHYASIILYSLAILSMLREDGACDHSTFVNTFFRRLGRIGYAVRMALCQEAK